MSSFQCSSASTAQQSPQTNPFTAIKAINRSELTKGAKVLYSQLRVSAGPKGFVYYRVSRLVEDTKSSTSSTKAYLQELRSVGLVIPEYRPGHSNKWFVFDPDSTWDGTLPVVTQPEDQRGGSRDFDGGVAGGPAPLKNVLKDVHNKTLYVPPLDQIERVPDPENDNVTNVIFSDHFQTQSPEPQPDPSPAINADCPTITTTPQQHCNPDIPVESKPRKVFNTQLLTEILDLTGDIKSRDCWISVINQVPEDKIRYALDCLKMTLNDGTVYRPGAYLLAIVMANNPNLILRGRKYRSPQVSSPERYQPQTYDSPDEPQPEARRFHEPEPVEEIDTEALIKGWKLLYNPDRIQSVLFNVGQCLPDWDVTGVWENLKQDRAGQPELEVLDEFLELAALRVQFQSTVGEPSTCLK